MTDHHTTHPDAAADVEAAHALPTPDDRPTVAEVVDEDGWHPGRPDYGRWGVGIAGST